MSQTTTCRTCGASLALDQRYCLGCGTRVAAPRLDFLAESERAEAAARAAAGAGPDVPTAIHPTAAGVAGAAPGTAGAAGALAPAPSRLDKVGGPMGAAAVVLVALGVGFLIGQGGNDAPPVQKAPVVNIEGGLPTGGTAAPTTDVTVDDTTVDDAAGGGADAAARGGGRAAGRRAAADDAARVAESTRDIPKSTGAEDTGGDINRLRAQPKETATPGAPPPVDDEAAGGGSEATSIG
jgi:hypothetical protein